MLQNCFEKMFKFRAMYYYYELGYYYYYLAINIYLNSLLWDEVGKNKIKSAKHISQKNQHHISAVCVIWKFEIQSVFHRSRSSQFCVLCVTRVLLSTKYKSCCQLMKIWRINSWLDWTVMSESDKTFSFMDVAIFDIISVTVGMVTGKEYGLDYHCMFIQTVAYSKRNCNTTVSGCVTVNGTFWDSHL